MFEREHDNDRWRPVTFSRKWENTASVTNPTPETGWTTDTCGMVTPPTLGAQVTEEVSGLHGAVLQRLEAGSLKRMFRSAYSHHLVRTAV